MTIKEAQNECKIRFSIGCEFISAGRISTIPQILIQDEKVYTTNKNLIMLIEQNQKWHGFSQYFKDQFSKYYLES